MVSNEDIKRMLDAKRKGVHVEKINVENNKTKICPHCKTSNPEKSIFCVKCGKKLENIPTNKCPSCNHPNPVDAKFCVNCGQNLKITEEENIVDKKSDDIKDDAESVPAAKTEEASEDIEKNEIPQVKVPTSVPEHAIITKTGQKKTCPACNGKNLKNAKFCVVCGEKFEDKKENEAPEQAITSNKDNTINGTTEVTDKSDTSEEDPVEKIKKAKELLDIGAITAEEFEEIKMKYIKLI